MNWSVQGSLGTYVDSRIFRQVDGCCLLSSLCNTTFLHETLDMDMDSAVVPTCASLEHADHCYKASCAQVLQVPSVSVDAGMVEV